MTNQPIYAVYPGPVQSKTDGQRHHISAGELCMLYGVDMRECVIVMPRYYDLPYYREFIARADKLIRLLPRYDGDYTLPNSRPAAG